MPRLQAVFVVLGVLATVATCAEEQPLRLRRAQLFGRRRDGFLGKVHEDDVYELPKDSKAPSTGFFNQKLDNFNSSNQQTWQQYYWVNNAFYSSGGPIFLMLGGEGPTSSGWVSENSQVYFITLARKYNAMVFQLEHRYYGHSHPTSDMSTANLRYLSSRQALADMSNFIQAMNQQYGFQNPKWITFGGSYSGALSGWARMLYPNQILGAIATSGPVQAQVEFKEYFDVVTAALGDYKQDCVANIRASTDRVASLIGTTSGQQTLRQKFKLCNNIDWNNQKNVQNFWSAIFGNFQSAVQYSEDNIGVYVDVLNRKTVCDLMTSTTTTDPLDRFAAVNDLVMSVFGEDCIDVDYRSLIQYLQQTTWNQPDTSYRLWIYQTCTEFGYFQNTNTPSNPFEDKIPLSFYVDMCTDIFGSQFTNSTVFAAIDATNAFYGGRAGFNGTNVVLPNGSVDPWHALGILTSPSTDSPAIYIQGTAHCADMYPPSPRDPAGLTLARQLIDHNIGVWLGTTQKLKLL